MIFEQLNLTGQWWFPKSDIKFEGHLAFDSEKGGILTIYGSIEPFILLDTSTEELNKDDTAKKLILGETTDKKNLTLVFTLPPNKHSITSNQYSYEERKFKIEFIFLNMHFEKVEDIEFEYILVEYSNLDKWISDTDIQSGYYFLTKNRATP